MSTILPHDAAVDDGTPRMNPFTIPGWASSRSAVGLEWSLRIGGAVFLLVAVAAALTGVASTAIQWAGIALIVLVSVTAVREASTVRSYRDGTFVKFPSLLDALGLGDDRVRVTSDVRPPVAVVVPGPDWNDIPIVPASIPLEEAPELAYQPPVRSGGRVRVWDGV